MSREFLDDGARRAFADAVSAIESTSAVEVVIAVRARARTWPHAPLLMGIAAGWLVLAFLLFSDYPFSLLSFLVDPLAIGALVGAVCWRTPFVSRALTRPSTRRRAVIEAARATFYQRGIHHTRGRTGVLLYVALTEQMAELVADDGVMRAVKPAAWQAAAAAIDRGVRQGGSATAANLASLASLCAKALPRATDDANELPDALDDAAPFAKTAAHGRAVLT